MNTENFDKMEFRKTLGQFATGVTVITTLDSQKEPIGITVSSFNSLSMDPPMILWSLDKNAYSLPAFQQAKFFNVHVLRSDQDHVSNRFASKSSDKFDTVQYAKGSGGTPILDEYAALFECETAHQYEGGDHIIFVGLVRSFTCCEEQPLLFHGGVYAGLNSLI